MNQSELRRSIRFRVCLRYCFHDADGAGLQLEFWRGITRKRSGERCARGAEFRGRSGRKIFCFCFREVSFVSGRGGRI